VKHKVSLSQQRNIKIQQNQTTKENMYKEKIRRNQERCTFKVKHQAKQLVPEYIVSMVQLNSS